MQPLVLAVVPDIDAQERRQRVDQPFAERLVEADHHADQSGQRSAATVTQQLVAWTDALHRQVEEIARRGTGLADQAVPETVRHQREAARGQERRRVAVGREPAVACAGSAYVTFSPDLAVPEAPAAIRAFTAAAVAAGLRRLVLLSGRGEPNAQLCEEIVRSSDLETTVLRASWFAQNFGEGVFLDGVRQGVVAVPAGRVREPFLDVDDLADVAVAALTEDGHDGEVYELTGPRLLSFEDVAATLSRATGREVRYLDLSPEEFHAAVQAEAGPEFAAMLTELVSQVLDGRNESLGDGVERALGRTPRDFATYTEATAATGIWGAT